MKLEHIWPRSLRRLRGDLLRQLDDETFAELLRRIRRRAFIHSGSFRHARERCRVLLRRRRPYGHSPIPKRMLVVQYKESALLDGLVGNRRASWVPPKRRTKVAHITLQNFSFIDNPIGTLQLICTLIEAEAECRDARVDFDDPHMLDIGPYLVWGLMQKDMAPYMTGGRISNGVRQALLATGLRAFMGISVQLDYQERRIVPFRLRQRRAAGTSTDTSVANSPSTKEKIGEELVQTVNRWLRAAGGKLTDEGKHKLYVLSAEILDNAERHSRQNGDGDWAVAGLMERRRLPARAEASGPEDVFVCNFAFVNLGMPIGDTIRRSQDPRVQSDIGNYLARHARRRGAEGERERSLLATTLALQDGISRFAQEGGARGGVGLMTAAEAVADLHDHIDGAPQAGLTIISGTCCVHFSGEYLGCLEEEHLRYQWFNPEQSPNAPPSVRHVFPLPAPFPGTIISARFVLEDSAYSLDTSEHDLGN